MQKRLPKIRPTTTSSGNLKPFSEYSGKIIKYFSEVHRKQEIRWKVGGENTRKLSAIITLLVILLPLFAMTFPLSSAAGKPTDVSGTWEPITGGAGITPDEHTAGPNHFHGFYNRGQYKTGPISGTFIQYSNYTIHTDTKPFAEVAPFDFMWRLDRTITATVEGKTGIIHMQLICRGTAYATGQAANMNRELTGTWNIISATDQLEGLHGQGTWYQHKGAITLFYEGKLFFS